MEKVKEPIPFLAAMREARVYHQVGLTINPDTLDIKINPVVTVPAESVTECSGIQSSVDYLDRTFSFREDNNLSNLPRGAAAQIMLGRICKELRAKAEECNADYILISEPQVLENTKEHYRVRIHYMLMVKT